MSTALQYRDSNSSRKEDFDDKVAFASEPTPVDQAVETVLQHHSTADQEHYTHDLEYTAEEEAAVVRRLDLRLYTALLLSTFVLNIDRTNISNAISGGLPKDLGFTINTVNAAQQVYAAVFTCATLVGAVLGKRIGPQRLIPILMFSWGLVTLAHALITNEKGYFTVRAFIALTEGPVIPCTLVYINYFYKSREIVKRLALFWGVQAIASAVSGLMAAGLLKLNGTRGLEGWKWLFIVDGIITVSVSFFLWFYLPESIASKRNILGLTERQKQIAVTRTIRDDPAKIAYLTTQVTWNDVRTLLAERGVWTHLLITSIGLTPTNPLATYLPTVIKTFHFNVFVSNALTAPIYVTQCFNMFLLAWHSDRHGYRSLHGLFGASYLLVGFILLRALPADAGRGGHYVSAFIAASWPLTHGMNIGWLQENVAGVGKRTLANGLVIGAANIYAIWASQIYRADDAPYFHRGNDICIAFAAASVLIWLYSYFQYKGINASRAAKLATLSPAERKQVELNEEKDGNRSLLFRHSL